MTVPQGQRELYESDKIASAPDAAVPNARSQVAMVRSESLRCFDELVRSVGGNPDPLFAALRIDAGIAQQHDQFIPYRQMMQLLENAADYFSCPDFGMQLAKRQYAEGILGPLDIAMRNSQTVGDAWRFCAEHLHAYSSGAHLTLAKRPEDKRWSIRFDVVMPRVYRQRQVAEHALLMAHLATKMFSGGQAIAREVWFTHEPLSDATGHTEAFGCVVHFAQPFNALFYDQADLDATVVGRDARVFELASFFLDARFPAPDAMIGRRVRTAIEQLLGTGGCTQIEVASALAMHPRTLQRRLRGEGENFEAIKDEVRRDAAMRYLRETRLPMKTVAAMLGYSELSVLYRSCNRWFGEPPSTVRHRSDKSWPNHATQTVPQPEPAISGSD